MKENLLNIFWRSWDRKSWYISIVKPTRCTIFRVYWISLYMFRTVFPSIIRSSRLYIQHQVYVIQVRWLHASGPARWHAVNELYDIYLMLYVQSWTPDDGRKDRPKHVEWYAINSKNCASSWFYYRNLLVRSINSWYSHECHWAYGRTDGVTIANIDSRRGWNLVLYKINLLKLSKLRSNTKII